MPVSVTALDVLPAADVDRWRGDPGLSDEARVRLSGRHDGVVHLVADAGDDPVGYAQLDTADGAVEVVSDDVSTSTELVQAATERHGSDVLVWTHDEDGPLARAMAALHAEPERTLWRLRRPDRLLPTPRPLPDGVTLRAFEPDRDETAWLAVNSAAFAHHPEQGRTTMADLVAREHESWFDPAGFLLAERDGELVGFHWTKVHDDEAPPVGEVYVLGVAPSAQGTGLGGALLDAGLVHLRSVPGVGEIVLYVDDDNPTAVRLYERSGFTKDHRDVRYRVRHTEGT